MLCFGMTDLSPRRTVEFVRWNSLGIEENTPKASLEQIVPCQLRPAALSNCALREQSYVPAIQFFPARPEIMCKAKEAIFGGCVPDCS